MRIVKKRFIWFVGIIIAITLFAMLLGFAQMALEPVYWGDSTTIVNGFYNLPSHSLDVCFVGASQMFCTIDAENRPLRKKHS